MLYPQYDEKVLGFWEELPVFDITYDEALELLRTLERISPERPNLCTNLSDSEEGGSVFSKVDEVLTCLELDEYVEEHLDLDCLELSDTQQAHLRHLWVEKLVKTFIQNTPDLTFSQKVALEERYLLSYMPMFKINLLERWMLHKVKNNSFQIDWLCHTLSKTFGWWLTKGLRNKISKSLGGHAPILHHEVPQTQMISRSTMRQLWCRKLLGEIK